jgi:hemolysin activation/secretion protein
MIRLLLALTQVLCGVANAQIPQQLDPSRIRPPGERAGEPNSKPAPVLNLRLQSPERSPIPKAVDKLKFRLVNINYEGSTIFSKDELDSFHKDLVGKTLTLDDIRKVAAEIEARYHRSGFFLTRVFLPPQQVKNSEFQIRIIEGYIDSISVEGATVGLSRRLSSALEHLTRRRPAELSALEDALLRLNDMPGLSISGLLRASRQYGASQLIIQVEPRPLGAQLALANMGSLAIGPWIAQLGVQAYGMGPSPDELLGQFSWTPGSSEMKTIGFRYSVAMGSRGKQWSLGLSHALVHPGGQFLPLKLKSESTTISSKFRYPIYRTLAASSYLEWGLNLQQSQSAAQGELIVRDQLMTQSLGLSGLAQTRSFGQFAGSLQLSHGYAAKSSMPSLLDADRQLLRLNMSISHRVGMLPNTFITSVIQGQHARQGLLSGERFALGGMTLRGYDPSTLVGDRGYRLSTEMAYEFPGTMFGLTPANSKSTLYGFFDYGAIENLSRLNVGKHIQHRASTGFGFRWEGQGGARLEMNLARRLDQFDNDLSNASSGSTNQLYGSISVPLR